MLKICCVRTMNCVTQIISLTACVTTMNVSMKRQGEDSMSMIVTLQSQVSWPAKKPAIFLRSLHVIARPVIPGPTRNPTSMGPGAEAGDVLSPG
jgi:hypothetical protein